MMAKESHKLNDCPKSDLAPIHEKQKLQIVLKNLEHNLSLLVTIGFGWKTKYMHIYIQQKPCRVASNKKKKITQK
jgi:hypothetical protein